MSLTPEQREAAIRQTVLTEARRLFCASPDHRGDHIGTWIIDETDLHDLAADVASVIVSRWEPITKEDTP